jgi:hypothetical protein
MLTGRRQYGVVASMALMVVLGACGSSGTGPTPQTASQLANHFDQIYVAYQVAGTKADSTAAEYIAEYVETPAAYGATDASVTATTTSGTQTWRGEMFGVVFTNGDTNYYATLYPNQTLPEVIIVQISYANGAYSGSAAIGTTDKFVTIHPDSVVSGTVTLVSAGSACSLQSGLSADSFLTSLFTGFGCTAATVNVSLSVGFAASTSLGTVAFSNVTLNGELFTQSGATHVVGIPSRGAAAALSLQSLFDRRR